MNFIHLLLSQFFTVIFQFRTSNSLQNYHNFLSWRSNVIVISKRSKGLLAHCTLFSLRQLGIFSRCKDLWHHVIKPMHKISFVIFRQSICLASTHVGMCHLFIIVKSVTEFSTSRIIVCFSDAMIDDYLFSGFLCNRPRRTLVRLAWPGVESVLTGRESSPKTCL